MVQALRDIIHHKIEMWNASSRLEQLCEIDIDTGGGAIEALAVVFDDINVIDEDDVKEVLRYEGFDEKNLE